MSPGQVERGQTLGIWRKWRLSVTPKEENSWSRPARTKHVVRDGQEEQSPARKAWQVGLCLTLPRFLRHCEIYSLLYSVILTEYVAIEPRVCVRLSVCLSVCASVCVISTAQTVGPILMKLYTNDLEYICQCHFSRFLKFRI